MEKSSREEKQPELENVYLRPSTSQSRSRSTHYRKHFLLKMVQTHMYIVTLKVRYYLLLNFFWVATLEQRLRAQ